MRDFTNPGFYILSAYLATADDNEARHADLIQELTSRGVSFREVEGVFNGEVEKSVLLSGSYSEVVHQLCDKFEQECYLQVDCWEAAHLRDKKGDILAAGEWRKAKREEALGVDHTEWNGNYYVVDWRYRAEKAA